MELSRWFAQPPLRLRLDDESDEQFHDRVRRMAAMARVLVDACLANCLIQERIAAGSLTIEQCRKHPTVRIEFEQAIAFGGIGETLAATQNKYWGGGPWLMPLEPDDEFFADRITYLYRESSIYIRRFEQRMRLKQLLGREHRKLVGQAKHFCKGDFLKQLTEREIYAIRRRLQTDPGMFWRACQGNFFLDLPRPAVQRLLSFDDP
jgi:hypothetical protein